MYRPSVIGLYGPSGNAKVTVGTKGGKKFVKVEFDDGETYLVPADNCPDYVQSGKFFVSMTPEKDSIRRMQPNNGRFRGKVLRFLSQEGQPPVPQVKHASFEGQSYDYRQFTVLIQITHPERYKGMEIYLPLRYHFGRAVEVVNGKPREVVGFIKPKSRHTALLDQFLEATGVWEKGPIPYSDNILPILQKRILEKGMEFEFAMKDGWVEYIIVPDPNEGLEENDDWDESTDEQESPSKGGASKGGFSPDFTASADEEEEENGSPWEDVEESPF